MTLTNTTEVIVVKNKHWIDAHMVLTWPG